MYARESGIAISFARKKGPPVTSALEPTANLNEVRLLLTRLQNEVSFSEENGGTALSIMESMLAAESEEELFDRQEAGAVSSKDFVLRPFRASAGEHSVEEQQQGVHRTGWVPLLRPHHRDGHGDRRPGLSSTPALLP
jgi:hypothetical protein